MALLEVKNLSLQYETRDADIKALSDVTFSVDAGERLGVVGESGSGKSTLGAAILGLVSYPGRVTGGKVFFEGKDISRMSKGELTKMRGDGVTMIFQDSRASLNPVITVEEHFRDVFRCHFRGESKRAWRERAVALLKDVGITEPQERLRQYAHQLSGGMAQRVLIALALAQSPKVIIADEITTALDVTLQGQVLDLLKELSEEKGTGLVLISHDINLISYFSDRVIVMYAGMVAEEGLTKEVFEHPYHPYTKTLMASLPTGEKQKLSTIEGESPSLAKEFTMCPFVSRCPWREDRCFNEKPPLRMRDNQKTACFFDI